MTSKSKYRYALSLLCILAAMTAALLFLPQSARPCFAGAKANETLQASRINIPLSPGESWDEDALFAGHATLKNLNSIGKLRGQDKIIYLMLKKEIEKVADGERSSTSFSIPVSNLLGRRAFTAKELGFSDASTNTAPTKEEVADYIKNKLFDFSPRLIITALIGDCPYELYWYDRSKSTIQSWPQYQFDAATGLSFQENAAIVFQLPVNQAYAANDFQADTQKTGSAAKAAANARRIVAEAAGKSDYEKLAFYCKKICELTSYNENAAAKGAEANSDPWQLIYVFDNDPSTNVVCEGYAKAFQYLCDETAFSNANIYCYTVNGTAYSGKSPGLHMWNLVHMGSRGNYLVDVTNCDTGTIGADQKLFLTGYTYGSVQSGYTIKLPAETYSLGNSVYVKPETFIQYKYSEDMYSLFSATELSLAQGGNLMPHLISDNEAHTHAYETDFFWNADLSGCSFAIHCQTNPAHAASGIDCNVTKKIQTPGTCNEKGTAIYTARAYYAGAEYSDEKLQELDLDPANHSGGTDIQNARNATKTQDGYTGDVHCQGCGALLQTGEAIPAKKKQPSDETDGSSAQTPGSVDSDRTLDKIKAKKAFATIKAGKSIRFQLNASLDKSRLKKIAYRSSKKSVAKVSKTGKITGEKAGNAVIKATVTLKTGEKKTISMKIKVKE